MSFIQFIRELCIACKIDQYIYLVNQISELGPISPLLVTISSFLRETQIQLCYIDSLWKTFYWLKINLKIFRLICKFYKFLFFFAKHQMASLFLGLFLYCTPIVKTIFFLSKTRPGDLVVPDRNSWRRKKSSHIYDNFSHI